MTEKNWWQAFVVVLLLNILIAVSAGPIKWIAAGILVFLAGGLALAWLADIWSRLEPEDWFRGVPPRR